MGSYDLRFFCSPGKDEGSTFYFYIPYCEVPAEEKIIETVEYFNGKTSQDQDLSPDDYRMPPIPRVPNQKQAALINSYKSASPSLRESFEKPEKLSLLLAEVSRSVMQDLEFTAQYLNGLIL